MVGWSDWSLRSKKDADSGVNWEERESRRYGVRLRKVMAVSARNAS